MNEHRVEQSTLVVYLRLCGGHYPRPLLCMQAAWDFCKSTKDLLKETDRPDVQQENGTCI